MTDLTTLGASHAAGFSGAERWEVVMVDIALAINGFNGIKTLPFIEHTKGTDGENLRLTALEKTRSVYQRQVIGLHHDGSNLIGRTSVNALACLNNHNAHGMLFQALELNGNGAAPLLLLFLVKLSLDCLHKIGHFGHTRLLIGIF